MNKKGTFIIDNPDIIIFILFKSIPVFWGLLTFIFMHLLRCKYLEIEYYIRAIRRLASTQS